MAPRTPGHTIGVSKPATMLICCPFNGGRNLQINYRARSGVSTVVIAVVAILIVAAAGATAYFLYASPAPSQGPTTGAMTSSTYLPPTTAASSQMASTTAAMSTTETSTASTAFSLPTNETAFLKLFSAITVQLSSSNGTSNGAQVETISYRTIGSQVVSGVPTTEVNFTYSSGSGSANTIALFYANNGTVVAVMVGGQTLTGAYAQDAALGVTSVFNLFLNYNNYFNNPGYNSQLSYSGTSTQTFGSVTMDVTTYTASSVVFNGITSTGVTISFGKVPNSNYSMVVYLKGTATSAKGTVTGTWQLISATPA